MFTLLYLNIFLMFVLTSKTSLLHPFRDWPARQGKVEQSWVQLDTVRPFVIHRPSVIHHNDVSMLAVLYEKDQKLWQHLDRVNVTTIQSVPTNYLDTMLGLYEWPTC
jgi:hypothetical protein